MSRENVDLVRQAVDAYNRRDVSALQRLAHPEAEVYDFLQGRAENAPFRGPAGVAKWLSNEAELWDEIRVTDVELREVGDRVLILGQGFARGKGSGLAMQVGAAWVVGFKEHRISYVRAYLDHGEALEAVGLGE